MTPHPGLYSQWNQKEKSSPGQVVTVIQGFARPKYHNQCATLRWWATLEKFEGKIERIFGPTSKKIIEQTTDPFSMRFSLVKSPSHGDLQDGGFFLDSNRFAKNRFVSQTGFFNRFGGNDESFFMCAIKNLDHLENLCFLSRSKRTSRSLVNL